MISSQSPPSRGARRVGPTRLSIGLTARRPEYRSRSDFSAHGYGKRAIKLDFELSALVEFEVAVGENAGSGADARTDGCPDAGAASATCGCTTERAHTCADCG